MGDPNLPTVEFLAYDPTLLTIHNGRWGIHIAGTDGHVDVEPAHHPTKIIKLYFGDQEDFKI